MNRIVIILAVIAMAGVAPAQESKNIVLNPPGAESPEQKEQEKKSEGPRLAPLSHPAGQPVFPPLGGIPGTNRVVFGFGGCATTKREQGNRQEQQ